MRPDLRLYALVDPQHSGGRDLAALARELAEGGATLIQLRDKTVLDTPDDRIGARDPRGAGRNRRAADRQRPGRCRARRACRWRACRLGRHAGRRCAAFAWTRRDHRSVDQDRASRCGPRGSNCSTMSASAACSRPHPRTIPIRRSATDGLHALSDMIRQRAPDMPAGAIAGIDERNAAAVIAAGADGIAVISALSLAPEPKRAAATLRGIVDRALAERKARHEDTHRRDHRRLGFERRRGHPGRSQDLFRAGCLRRVRHRGADRAEHARASRPSTTFRRPSSRRRSMRCFPISMSAR